jgi:heat-inducible transcriptional repressor
MNALKLEEKGSKRKSREYEVLLGLISYYLKTGKPVGSNTLKEAGFHNLSSATIRNYFANLEKDGFLTQQHASGGRIPTVLAYKTYAKAYEDFDQPLPQNEKVMESLRNFETKEIALYLQQAAELLSSLSQTAVFLSAPRFDHDYILDVKILPLDQHRCLAVILTDFGLVKTEVMHLNETLSEMSAKKIESYIQHRIQNKEKPKNLEKLEERLALKIYNELMVRYIVSYSNFTEEELYRTGFSKLLIYPEFQEAKVLSLALSLFENTHNLRLLTKECCKFNHLRYWIGDDLAQLSSANPECSILTIPYYINKNPAGAVGLLGPIRMPYKELFATLRAFSESISEALTKNLYKFKITHRHSGKGLPKEDKFVLLLE